LCFAFGRSNDGVKKTCARRKTLTIAGFALDGKRAERGFGEGDFRERVLCLESSVEASENDPR
jgi:hypothetical protein